MKKMMIVFSLLMMGCASGNCRHQEEVKKEAAAKTAVAPASGATGASSTAGSAVALPSGGSMKSDRVKVFKYDGSLQCGMGKPIAVEAMKKDLKGITVYSAQNLQDGLMHVSLCGSPTGKANVYEIDRSNLEKAVKLGFREWTFE